MTRRLGILVAVLVLAVAAAALAASWTSISVDSVGQFSTLSDGTLRYTHRLVNYTWHPLRYVVAADPASPVGLTLIKVVSSMPEKTVTRTQPSESGSPWSTTVVVPGHQQATFEVTFRSAEPAGAVTPVADTDMGGRYPTLTVYLSLER
jgi:hypothetical protein